MQAYDILILALLIAAGAWGARRGLAKQLATLISLTLGYAVAMHFRQDAARLIELAPPWNILTAMFALFALTSLAVWVIFQFLSVRIEKLGLANFDAQMGAMLGLIKGGVLAMVLTMFAVVMLGDGPRQAVLDSFSGYRICSLLQHTHAVVPSEWQQAMQPYFETLEEHSRLADGQPSETAPGDLGLNRGPTTHYDDPQFAGQAPPSRPQPNEPPFRANRSSDVDEGSASQARLLDPAFDRR